MPNPLNSEEDSLSAMLYLYDTGENFEEINSFLLRRNDLGACQGHTVSAIAGRSI
jgi:hypothetical protein